MLEFLYRMPSSSTRSSAPVRAKNDSFTPPSPEPSTTPMSSVNISDHFYSTVFVLSSLLDALHTFTQLILTTIPRKDGATKVRAVKCLAQGLRAGTGSTFLALFTIVLPPRALCCSKKKDPRGRGRTAISEWRCSPLRSRF